MALRARHAPARIATIITNEWAKTSLDQSRSAGSRLRSEPGGGRQRPRPGGALGLEQVGQQECKVDRLLGIEPRVADRVVTILEVGVGDHAGAARALGDVLAGHLQMHAAAMGPFGAVN